MPTVTTVSTVSTMSAVSTVYSAVLPPSLMAFFEQWNGDKRVCGNLQKVFTGTSLWKHIFVKESHVKQFGGKIVLKRYADTYFYFLICAEKQKRSWKFNLDILWNVITQSWGKVTLLLNIENRIKLKRVCLFYGNFVLNISTHVLKFLRLYQR